MSTSITLSKPRLSIKAQTLYTVAAVAAAVAVPQLFHMIGALSGAGTVPGQTFLPMHLPIILVGLLAGPYAGAVAGLLGPIASFALSGMPGAAMLPFMMIELCFYGLAAGLMRNIKIPDIFKVLIAQFAGRAVYALTSLIAVNLFGNGMLNAAAVFTTSILTGLPGLILQWTLLPLIAYRIDGIKRK